MPQNMYIQELDLHKGVVIRIKGDILPDASVFKINLGKNQHLLAFHYNARFNYYGQLNTVICNDLTETNWGTEQKGDNFPYVRGTTIEITITFDENGFRVRTNEDYTFTFPNRLQLEKLQFMSFQGDLNVRKVEFQ
ncbi:16 kDa beta-galactoside-binding lectin-like [Vombatus ursinus]|uniref:16 kDa beta-galactoside-binding lectin-like n=1 Tax=Vombatus ursinus TaxID=29139 RepID=UPI000FFD5126|nr:16 kDa beta-galactoside-binding lectin-like [Vombatus ursinus]